MLACYGAVVREHQVVHFVGKFVYYLSYAWVPRVDQGNDVEIPVANMAGNRISKLVVRQYLFKFWQKLNERVRRHHKVVYKRRGAPADHLFTQEVKALAPHHPVFARGPLCLCNAHLKVRTILFYLLGKLLCFFCRFLLRDRKSTRLNSSHSQISY